MKRDLIGMVLAAVITTPVISGYAPAEVDNKENTIDSKGVLADNEKESGSGTGKAMDGEETFVSWTGLSRQAGEVTQQVIDDYNNSQDRVFVGLQYQGPYQESLGKLKTSMCIQDEPDLVQIYGAGTRTMIDSGFIIPMQQVIDGYSIDVSGPEENILNYYTADDQLYSILLNTSVPACYYNRTVFSETGYENGPQSWDDTVNTSRKMMDQGLPKSGVALCSNLI